MSIKTFAAAAALLALGVPALAQNGPISATSRQYDDRRSRQQETRRSDNGMRSAVTTRSLNRRSASTSRARIQRRAEYRRDRRAYMAAVMARHRQSVRSYNRAYARREMAYANAMAAWRRQVSACHGGNRAACRAPSPRVADFY